MKIRRATINDAAALAEIAERTFRDTFAKDNTPEDLEAYVASAYGETLQRRELEDPESLALLGEAEDGTLIAYTQMRRVRSPHGEVEIARFYVDRTYHGQGLAQQLMNAAVGAARGLGATTLWLGVWERNLRAIAFYAKCGFQDVGSQPFLVGSDLQTDRVMARVISSS
jgi:ribosomal protein S18 acetylase RimI-like enzyme